MSARVVNFYRFAELSDLQDLKAKFRAEAARLGLLGTILLAPEGVNVALYGDETALAAFVAWVRKDDRLADVEPKLSAAYGPPFRRLEVKVKRWIIRFAEAQDPSIAAVRSGARLTPVELQALLREPREDVVLVDTRNEYETGYGSFAGAVRLPIRTFTEFPAAFAERFAGQTDKTFVFFCTGGVRCEKVVPWAAERGFANATQLDGGILAYFKETGGDGFSGDCFVFDDRWSVDASLSPPPSQSA